MERARLTNKDYEKAIIGTGGIIANIAARLKITPGAVRARFVRNPKLRELLDQERETTLDMAETTIQKAAASGDVSAAKFLLLTLGKSRGYTYRQEVEATVQAHGQVHLHLPDNLRD